MRSFSERPELRSLQTRQSHESAMQKKSWRSGGTELKNKKPTDFVEMITEGHKVLNEEQHSRLQHKHAVVVQKFGDAMDSKLSMQDQISSSWIEITNDLRRTGPKQIDMQNELYDKRKKELRQHWFSLDSTKAGGQKPRSVTAISEDVQDSLADGQTAYERRFNSRFAGPSIPPGGTEIIFNPIPSKDPRSNASVQLKNPSWKIHLYALNAGGSWTGGLLIVEMTICEQFHHLKILVKRF